MKKHFRLLGPLLALLLCAPGLFTLLPVLQSHRAESQSNVTPVKAPTPPPSKKVVRSKMALATTYVVAGAGNAAVNGTYPQDGVDIYYGIAKFTNGFAVLQWDGTNWKLWP